MRTTAPAWAPWAEPNDAEAGYHHSEHAAATAAAGYLAPNPPLHSQRASSRYSQPSQVSSSRYSQPTELTLTTASEDSRLSTIYSRGGRQSPDASCTSPRGLVIRTPSPVTTPTERYHVRSQASDFDFGFEGDKDPEYSPKSISTAGSSRHLSSHRFSERY
jgi:hypothetical protein